jgi:L-alanine-DL-glutamate epimerase-like enolase superfamily enzyme
MRITRIAVHQVDLPVAEGSYAWADQAHRSFDSTVVRVDTDEGITGWGETCPLGSTYLAAYPEGARAGIARLAGDLIGLDPTATDAIADAMDASLKGHPYAKSALDTACWDILGKATGRPVSALLGGRRQDSVRLYKVVTRGDPARMADDVGRYRAQGITHFQVKVGADPATDIERLRRTAAAMRPGEVMDADANCGWRRDEAIRVVHATDGLAEAHGIRLYIEQPCPSYEACLAVRRICRHPFILDECMDGLPVLLRGWTDGAMDAINLKINRFGGLTRARLVRDLCVALGLPMNIEDSWGGEIATAAIAHLASSTPPEFHFQSAAFHEWSGRAIATGAPQIADGRMTASDRPGLGIEPIMDVLGKPVAVIP